MAVIQITSRDKAVQVRPQTVGKPHGKPNSNLVSRFPRTTIFLWRKDPGFVTSLTALFHRFIILKLGKLVGYYLLGKMSLSHEVPILCSANYGTQAQLGRNHQMRMIEASVRTTKTARRKHRKSIRNPRPSQRANLSGPFASSNWKLKSLRWRSSTRTEYHSRILTPVKDPPEASTTIDQKAIAATLKKNYSPISLAIATFVTAGIYFVL